MRKLKSGEEKKREMAKYPTARETMVLAHILLVVGQSQGPLYSVCGPV